MTILEFFHDFCDDHSCKVHFKIQREHQCIICKKNVAIKNIIDLNLNGNVLIAYLEPLFEVELLWNQRNILFMNDICVWLLCQVLKKGFQL
jgi:hypothetical protein